MERVTQFVEANSSAFLSQWFEALKIPSVSAQKEHKADMLRMVNWLVSFFKNKLGMVTRVIETDGNPLVYAESPKLFGAPTILVYGHYDVQPAEPFSDWVSDPFSPTVRDGKVYCRGANDDKGQWCIHLCGLQAFLALYGSFPVQIKFILEGEEEVGSDSLSKFLDTKDNCNLLKCDALVVSDTSAAGPKIPAITYGLRGVMSFEMKLLGPRHDLHSGIYGGSVYNPAIALSKMMGAIIDESGRIQVPHFYDDVEELSAFELNALANNPFDPEENEKQIGVSSEFGEPGYSTLERRGARPSFDINGLTSGYQGEGGKTIIPSWALAKFTFRTVPNQIPEKVRLNVEQYLSSMVPPGIRMELCYQQGSGGMVTSLTGKYIVAASRVLEKVFGRKPLFVRDGGSIPIVAKLRQTLDAETVLVGFGLDDDGIHSPNEKFNLESFFDGIKTSILLWKEFGRIRN